MSTHSLKKSRQTLALLVRRTFYKPSLVNCLSHASNTSQQYLFTLISLIYTIPVLRCGLFFAFSSEDLFKVSKQEVRFQCVHFLIKSKVPNKIINRKQCFQFDILGLCETCMIKNKYEIRRHNVLCKTTVDWTDKCPR